MTSEVRDSERRTPRLGLALGGGAELGLAHLGILRVLKEAHLPVDCIAGSSAGALVAAFCAAGAGIEDMVQMALRLNWRRLQRMTLPVLALSSNEPMRRYLALTLPAKEFENLVMPLRLVATDLLSAEMVVFEGGPGLKSLGLVTDPDVVFLRGDLHEAIRASCTRPVINRPVELRNRLLVDGCLTNNVPSLLVRDMGAVVVAAVDLMSLRRQVRRPTNILAYAIQTQGIHLRWALKNRHVAADVLIRPDFSGLEQTGFSHAQDMILAGERAAREAVPKIRQALAACGDAEARQAP